MVFAAESGPDQEEVRFGAQSALFVEGRIDEDVVNTLVGDQIAVKIFGSSYSIHNAAQALRDNHPFYYFLIDRDCHHDDEFVQKSWDNFLVSEKHNLLVWHKRELENYFLDPEFLSQSAYRDKSQNLEQEIVKQVSKRLYMDAANYVIISIREELKETWINKFSSESKFATEEEALSQLTSAEEFKNHLSTVSGKVSPDELKSRFNCFLKKMTGGQKPINFGEGAWIDMIEGKEVLNSVINSTCFKVKSKEGKLLDGEEKRYRVIMELLKGGHTIPSDFEKLRELIRNRPKPG